MAATRNDVGGVVLFILQRKLCVHTITNPFSTICYPTTNQQHKTKHCIIPLITSACIKGRVLLLVIIVIKASIDHILDKIKFGKREIVIETSPCHQHDVSEGLLCKQPKIFSIVTFPLRRGILNF